MNIVDLVSYTHEIKHAEKRDSRNDNEARNEQHLPSNSPIPNINSSKPPFRLLVTLPSPSQVPTFALHIMHSFYPPNFLPCFHQPKKGLRRLMFAPCKRRKVHCDRLTLARTSQDPRTASSGEVCRIVIKASEVESES